MKKRSLGLILPDEILKVSDSSGHFKKGHDVDWKDVLLPGFKTNQDQEKSNWRILFFGILTLVIFFIIFLRLFHLQVVKGKDYRKLAEGNRIKIKVIHAPRGVVFDRDGKVLAQNLAGFRLVDPQTKKVTFLSREEALSMEVKNDPKVKSLEIDHIRTYPQGEQTAHVTGILGEISENQLREPRFKDYKIGDRMGLSGIEAEYEEYLRGSDGGEIIEVGAMGDPLRTLGKIHPTPGKNLILSLDLRLQQKAFEALKGAIEKSGSCCGAVLISDPKNGEILALISLPSFDSNLFETQGDKVEEILASKNSPILNRAIGGVYPPGSTFKIISSVAALTSGKINSQTEILDTGQITISGQKFSNWYFNQYGRLEGSVNLVKALKRSTDTYFYQVGQILGEKPFVEWAKKLRLGSKLNIDIPGEEEALVPDADWKQNSQALPWYPGDTLHLSIGQGFILTTPLQILGLTSFIAAGGQLYKPHLLQKVVETDGKQIKKYNPKVLVKDLIKRDYVIVIKDGLKEAASIGGTAWPFFSFPIITAGKTGTAEYGDPRGRTHAWYTAFAPADDPKIVVTVLIEGGGEGSSVAAPVVKEIMRYFFSEDKNNLIKDTYLVATDSARQLDE